jgi:hypothetical protein
MMSSRLLDDAEDAMSVATGECELVRAMAKSRL